MQDILTKSIAALRAEEKENTGLWWASRDTRWDVYPQNEPLQLVRWSPQGYFCPTPEGEWYKSACSFNLHSKAESPALFGTWVEEQVTSRCSLWKFLRDLSA